MPVRCARTDRALGRCDRTGTHFKVEKKYRALTWVCGSGCFRVPIGCRSTRGTQSKMARREEIWEGRDRRLAHARRGQAEAHLIRHPDEGRSCVLRTTSSVKVTSGIRLGPLVNLKMSTTPIDAIAEHRHGGVRNTLWPAFDSADRLGTVMTARPLGLARGRSRA